MGVYFANFGGDLQFKDAKSFYGKKILRYVQDIQAFKEKENVQDGYNIKLC